jgi:hypothetical protein
MPTARLVASRFASTAESSTIDSRAWAPRMRLAPGLSSISAVIHSRTIIRSMPARDMSRKGEDLAVEELAVVS